MTCRKLRWTACGLFGLASLLGACGNAQKEATEAALNAAQTAVSAARDEAVQYAPDQLKAAQDTIQAAKEALSRNDYAAALKGARDATGKAKGLAETIVAKKGELAKEWANLYESLPKQLEQVKSRLDAYSRGAKLPAGMDKAQLPEARTQYDQLKKEMAEAASAFKQGNLGEAMNKTADVKDRLAKLMALLGLQFATSEQKPDGI